MPHLRVALAAEVLEVLVQRCGVCCCGCCTANTNNSTHAQGGVRADKGTLSTDGMGPANNEKVGGKKIGR